MTGKIRISFSIADLHKGHNGFSSKVYASLIQPLHSSFVQDQTAVSTSGIGSFGPL